MTITTPEITRNDIRIHPPTEQMSGSQAAHEKAKSIPRELTLFCGRIASGFAADWCRHVAVDDNRRQIKKSRDLFIPAN